MQLASHQCLFTNWTRLEAFQEILHQHPKHVKCKKVKRTFYKKNKKISSKYITLDFKLKCTILYLLF